MTRRLIVLASFVAVGLGGLVQAASPFQQAARKVAAQIIPADQADDFAKDAAKMGDPGLTMPVLVKKVEPRYTPGAMREKIQGQVEVEAIVGIDGLVEKARVSKSLDQVFGLDESAVATAMQWEFKPGTANGQTVRTAIKVLLEFRLH